MRLYLDPSPIAWTIPWIEHPVTWYGICFATGLLLSFWQAKKWLMTWLCLKAHTPAFEQLQALLEKLLLWAIVGLVIGARSFEVIFYSPHITGLEIFQTWHGGLSSHGGILGVFLAIIGFWSRHRSRKEITNVGLSLSLLLDASAGASGLCAYMIRLGNFINQEILGKASDLPWAITFGSPAGALEIIPRHPVQLYEGFAYLSIWLFSKWRLRQGPTGGKLFCEALIAIFIARVVLEPFKAPLLEQDVDAFWQIGQLLSLPALALLLGFRLFFPFKKPSI